MSGEIKFTTENSVSFVSKNNGKLTYVYHITIGNYTIPINAEIDLSGIPDDEKLNVFEMIEKLLLS